MRAVRPLVQDRYRGRPSPGAELSALHGTRQGFQDPLAAALRTHTTLAHAQPLHGQSILEVLRTRPLTALAPGSDRRLSVEGHQVAGHRPVPEEPMGASRFTCTLAPAACNFYARVTLADTQGETA